jgi:hypothetical protein
VRLIESQLKSRRKKVKELELYENDLIDLGQASVETKGQGVVQIDTNGNPRLFAAGIAED